jgi:FkbM family methyltransferase
VNEARPISFDRATGRLEGATPAERCATLAFRAGARVSLLFNIRGFSIGVRAISSMMKPREMVIPFADDANFSFPFGDPYWSWLLDRSFVYEAEIERFLRGIADVDYHFVDGGANYGFWSVLVSSRAFGSHPVTAIEASSKNITHLAHNAEINNRNFAILHCAIGSGSGPARVTGVKHEAFHVEAIDGNSGAGESVEMVTLDDLVARGSIDPDQKLVIKLDVEGLEIEAVKGGGRLLDRDVILILEDHGGDRGHAVSRYLLSETACHVFVFDPACDRYVPLTDLLILDRIKINRGIGYNVFATRSAFWEERIRSTQ